MTLHLALKRAWPENSLATCDRDASRQIRVTHLQVAYSRVNHLVLSNVTVLPLKGLEHPSLGVLLSLCKCSLRKVNTWFKLTKWIERVKLLFAFGSLVLLWAVL